MAELLTREEVKTLIMALAERRGHEGFSEEEASALITWANGVRADMALLGLVLEGAMVADIEGGQLTFSLSEKVTA